MKDSGSQKGKGKKPEVVDGKAAAVETPVTGSKVAPLTAKEKISANQKNKRRR
ncbi:MAG: hypothetical protein NTV68_11030 [Methanomicrobiales archaeon]|nr:hypothetical protein [Methanomicrobiales archaeon]